MRPAWYALAPGGWRDYVTLLHPPYTAWHLSYAVVGGCLAPAVSWSRLGLAVLAFALPLVAAVLWGLLLAPRAARRLRHPARLIVKVVLLAAAAAALAVSGEVLWASGFLVVTAAVTIAGELRAARGDSPHR